MTLGDILSQKGSNVISVHADVTLEEVAGILAHHRIGAVVVLGESAAVVGIVSERDLVRVVGTSGSQALASKVSDIMTRDVRTASETMTIDEALALMTERRFRHLPVVEDDRLLGLVSIGDVVKRKIDTVEREAADIRDYILKS